MDPTTRPTCPQLKLNDPVIVRRSANDMRGRPASDQYIEARVVKAGRVWVYIERANLPPAPFGHRTWRMRLDTQDEGTQYSGSNVSFVTPEQHEYDMRLAAVDAVISDAGVRLDRPAPGEARVWTPARRVALADFIVSLGVLDGDR